MSKDRARQLRKKMTPPELRLWNALKTRPEGFKFRRQHDFDPYVLDFFCHEAALAIELDGFSRELGDNPQRDIRRDRWVAEQGVRTIRIAAIDVRDNLEAVVGFIVEECRQRSLGQEAPPPPSAVPLPCKCRGGEFSDS